MDTPPAIWPELPGARSFGVPDRPLASPDCPYCRRTIEPPPRAKRKCPHCGGVILVRAGPDGMRHLIAESDSAAVYADWHQIESERASEAERQRADLGILSGIVFFPVVRGTGFYQPALERIAVTRGDRFECVARLVREPSNPKDPNAIRVELYGEHVGYAVAGEDQEDVLDLLRELEGLGRHAWVAAEVARSKSNGKLYVELDGLPDEP